MVRKNFKGDLSEVDLPDVFEFLRTSRQTGVLTFRQERIRKSLYIRNGNVVFATSNLPEERLGELLLAWGLITKDQYTESVALLSSKKRQGRILVEMGALSPKQLWDSVQNQIRHIVYSLFLWEHGLFFFVESEFPAQENITTDINLFDLVVEGIRQIRDPKPIMRRFASQDAIFGRTDSEIYNVQLEPFERHVLGLIDGKKTLQEICRESEIGQTETIKVLYMLHSIGYTRLKEARVKEPGQEEIESIKDAHGVIGNYNRMFAYLYRYMTREVGPIAEHVLKKYLNELAQNSVILRNVGMRKDGTLDELSLIANLEVAEDGNKSELLLSSLNELLYAEMLAVKRTLGAEHEARIIETLKDIHSE